MLQNFQNVQKQKSVAYTHLDVYKRQVESSLSSSAATPVDELPEEMQDYMTYIPKMLVNNKILLTDSIDKSDETYKNYAGNKISVNEYLKMCIRDRRRND